MVIKTSIRFREWGADQITFYRGCLIRSPGTAKPSRTPDFTPSFLGGVCVAHQFSFLLCCPIMWHYAHGSVLLYSFCFPHEHDVRFVFTPSCLYKSSCLIYVICVCLHILVFNTYPTHIVLCFFVLFVFFLCFVYPMLPVSLDCRFLIAPSVFSNVYLYLGSVMSDMCNVIY